MKIIGKHIIRIIQESSITFILTLSVNKSLQHIISTRNYASNDGRFPKMLHDEQFDFLNKTITSMFAVRCVQTSRSS